MLLVMDSLIWHVCRADGFGGSKEATKAGANEVRRVAQVNVMPDDVFADLDSASDIYKGCL